MNLAEVMGEDKTGAMEEAREATEASRTTREEGGTTTTMEEDSAETREDLAVARETLETLGSMTVLLEEREGATEQNEDRKNLIYNLAYTLLHIN